VWAGVTLFFGIGVAIALAVAYRLLDRGSSIIGAIAVGACAGSYGAWFVFYLVLNALKLIRDRRRSARA
jgi:hypothetical protein